MKTRIVDLVLVMMLLLALTPSASLSASPAGSDVDSPLAGPVDPGPAEAQGWNMSNPPVAEEWDDLPPEVQAKVDPRILAELRGEVIPAHLGGGTDRADVAPAAGKPLDKTRFLVHLKARAALETIVRQRFATRTAQRTAVFDALTSTAQSTQGPVRAFLDARASQGDVAAYQPFYIFNGFAVEGNLDTIIELAQRDDVERIVANYPLVPLWNSGESTALPASGLGGLHPGNWNLDLVDAGRVWDELGITGEGAVVAGIDTGVDWTHPALQTRYRGYGPAAIDHNYNWFDPSSTLYPGGDLGPSRSVAPFDDGNHGTHTMGTMVGDGGAPGTQVGMAPGAEWIAISLNELSIWGSVSDDIMGQKAFQWMLCPTDLSGDLATADCSKAPDAVNNSWGSANPADDTFRPAIQALRAAGIAPVFAAGNPSAGVGSIGSPGSIPEAITVGATDVDDKVASFSGRGPSFYEGEQKPELVAPGVDINSTVPGGGYSGPTRSGTSMAAPHVAGLVALMVSADLQDGYRDFNVDELERFMERTAVDLGDPGPDDDYGSGRIDAFDAVRWARSAGDLQGTVRGASTSAPIAGATVTGVRAGPGDTFSTQTGVSGQYSTTVPAGTYDIAVEAWGYTGDTFSGQTVITGALSVADFRLTPMPTAALTGRVLDGGAPVDGARVYVVAKPSVSSTTGADGAYTLSLPVGTHEIAVETVGYRILREDVTVASGGSAHEFTVTPAPTILLVDADTYAGWFCGWPVRDFFQWSLDQENYLYDVWRIQYLSFDDTQVMPDGSIGYGIPSPTTLSAYDLVIWAHGGGDWGATGSTVDMGADDELMAYLDSGGRLIISGQDLGYEDEGTTFYDDYLHADCVMDAAGNEGDTVSGSDFLSGLNLEITNASLHGYPNGATGLWPDAAAPADGAAFPVLTYDNGNGGAALAVDPCDAIYRAVYFALGYENVAPRAGNRDPAIAGVLDRSIQWAMGSKLAYGVSMSTSLSRQMAKPGDTVTYDLQVANRGSVHATFALGLAGNTWPTRILSGTTEVNLTPVLPPCGWQDLTMEVDIPVTANTGAEDTATVTASRHPAGTPSASVSVSTVAFRHWQVETPMPTPRYRLAAANLPGDDSYYAIGGISWWGSINANERYDACTGEWETLAPMPTARYNVGAAVIDGKIYVPGGDAGYNVGAAVIDGKIYVPGGDAEGATLDVLEIYDPATDSWSTGARLPEPLSGAAVAAYGGKLYTFGGYGASGFVARTYAYDPGTDTWTEKAPMPYGGRAYAAAAELNGKIYVAGGWHNLRTVEVYDPATDSWSTAVSMNVGRQSPGMTAAPDGHLYVSGGGDGWTGLASAERYSPDTHTWEVISSLNDSNRAGSASAFAAGRVFAVGGPDRNSSVVNESLRLFDSFCLSKKRTGQGVVRSGNGITYMLELHSDSTDLAGASLVDPIPAGTTFAGFGVNPIGASFNSPDKQVEWSGTIPAGANPLTFTFGVDVAMGGWKNGDLITNVVTFDSGAGLVFSHTVGSVVTLPDASPSVKWVNKSEALAGDVLTYTIRVENGSAISDVFTMSDPIPANATYVPGSLTYTLGTAGYDPVDQAVVWAGTVPDISGTYVNTSGDHEWGDSDGNGAVPRVTFDWIDISGTGTNAGGGDDSYYCGLPIGFTFNFYGTGETTFCASTNGFVSFDTSGYSDLDNDCPLPDTGGNAAVVAGIWDDLLTDGGIYYQTFGTVPNRYLVVQWVDVRHWGSAITFDFEIILYENGAIKVQMLDAGPELGSNSTTGIEDYTETQGLTYACDTMGSIHDDLAVLFLPDGAAWTDLIPHADVTFAVTTAAPLPVNTWITNAATITGPSRAVERSAGTLINSADLSSSWKRADRTHAAVGDTVRYDFLVEHTGLLTATGATLIDPLPANVAYVPGSLTYALGSAGYDPVDRVITWTGTLPTLAGYVPGDYEWGDSDGNGTLPGVTYDWVEISGTGTPILAGVDEGYFYPVTLPFAFDFYGTGYTNLAVASDGTVYFENDYLGDINTPIPAPNGHGVDTFIAHLWDDLYVSPGAVYYEVQGSAPDRRLVIEYYQVSGCCPSPDHATWEVILYENGDVLMQYQDVTFGNWRNYGAGATIGIQNSPTEGLQYSYNTPVLSDGLAVLFSRPGTVPAYSDSAGISFAVTLATALLEGTPVTNTATLDNGYGDVYDLEAIFLARGSDLSGSFKQVTPGEAETGDTVTYTVFVRNVGGGAAMGEIRDELPPELRYETASLLCGTGSCGYASGVVTWTGTLGPRSMVPVRFRATVQAGAGGGGVITNTAVVTDVNCDIGYPVAAGVRSIRHDIYLPLVMRNR
jgi:uncharacterized repeat protein (TIGR01451 family)